MHCFVVVGLIDFNEYEKKSFFSRGSAKYWKKNFSKMNKKIVFFFLINLWSQFQMINRLKRKFSLCSIYSLCAQNKKKTNFKFTWRKIFSDVLSFIISVPHFCVARQVNKIFMGKCANKQQRKRKRRKSISVNLKNVI